MNNTLNSTAHSVIMVEPTCFGFNTQTAATNLFQYHPDTPLENIRETVMREFYHMVEILRDNNVEVLVLPNRPNVLTPDAVFPNNWFSHHPDGKLIIYPMLTPNRRLERQQEMLLTLLGKNSQTVDLTRWENKNWILEGTGSLVLDRTNKVAFAMESPRTNEQAFIAWCEIMDYQPVFFHAYDEKSFPIYHTNVVMSIGEKFAVVCLDAIRDKKEQQSLITALQKFDKEIIAITHRQLNAFCGNILQLQSKDKKPFIILSQTAFAGFTDDQKTILTHHGKLLPVSIPTIERIGGGSARCMLGEIF